MLLELGIGSLLARGDDELPPLRLAVGRQAEAVLGGAEELGLLDGVLASVVENHENLRAWVDGRAGRGRHEEVWGQRSDRKSVV